MEADTKQVEQPSDTASEAKHRLRQLVDSRLSSADTHIDDMTDLQLKNLIYELQVHQLELSIQNDELRETQLQLAHTRDQYLALYDRAPVAYLTLWDSGRISACNLATASLLGEPRNTLLGRRLQEFIAQEFQTDFHLYWQRLLHSQMHEVVELAIKSPQGNIIVSMESQCAAADEVCAEARWHVALTDISEQKQLQQNLASLNRELEQRVAVRTLKHKESRQELDAILNAVADAVITFDSEGRIEHVNRAAERLLGYKPGEIIGFNIRQLIPYSYLDQKSNFVQQFMLEEAVRSNPVDRGEIYVCAKNGVQIPTTIAIARVEQQDKFTAVLRDIRDIKALQRDVLKTAEAERSRISRELHDSLGQELVGMSMLAKSLATQNAVGEKTATELANQCYHFSHMLNRCVSKLRHIIFDLAPLELSEGGLADALQNVAGVVNRDTEVECRLNCERAGSGAGAEVDIQLLRIAREAVHNAIKHAHARHIEISLAGEDEIRLEVADDGKGMPENQVTDMKSQGIRIMQYRANVLGGKLLVEPNSPAGTRVICLLSQTH